MVETINYQSPKYNACGVRLAAVEWDLIRPLLLHILKITLDMVLYNLILCSPDGKTIIYSLVFISTAVRNYDYRSQWYHHYQRWTNTTDKYLLDIRREYQNINCELHSWQSISSKTLTPGIQFSGWRSKIEAKRQVAPSMNDWWVNSKRIMGEKSWRKKTQGAATAAIFSPHQLDYISTNGVIHMVHLSPSPKGI